MEDVLPGVTELLLPLPAVEALIDMLAEDGIEFERAGAPGCATKPFSRRLRYEGTRKGGRECVDW